MLVANDYALGERLSFAAGGTVAPYLMDGWSLQEADHRWTEGDCARLAIQIADLGDHDVVLRVHCRGFVIPGKVDRQVVTVLVNHLKVGAWEVAADGWHELTVSNARIRSGRMLVTFHISHPSAPSDHGISRDTRRLGMLALQMEVVRSPHKPALDWRGGGLDAIGDVFFLDGNYFRAIRKEAIGAVRELQQRGIYTRLADLKLIPPHAFVDLERAPAAAHGVLDPERYAALVMTPGAHWSVFPASYVFLQLLDAARAWLGINETLLEMAPDRDYGLLDGHYGNFAVFDNARPRWVDTGSIVADATRRGGWFGIDQFVRSFAYPLLMYARDPARTNDVRALMGRHYLGIPHEVFAEFAGPGALLDFRDAAARPTTRREALRTIRARLEALEYKGTDTAWSGYRGASALDSALAGRFLEADQDSRYRMVVDLARRSGARTFIDVGANDGLFSILCAREGRVGIATDVDDPALNRLYTFLGAHPELQITVAREGFATLQHYGELVLALALAHHLVLGQRLSFAEVSRKLASLCSKALITEFMPDGLGGVPAHPEPSPNPLPADYTLDCYVEALRRNFRHVEVVDYERVNPPSRRILIYCEK